MLTTTLAGFYFIFSVIFKTQHIVRPQVSSTSTQVLAATETKALLPTKSAHMDVPLYHQMYRLSCEAASLEMALAYKGVTQTQEELLTKIGVSEPKVSYIQNGVRIWGDPDLGFVGDVAGSFSNSIGGLETATGWGVSNVRIGQVAQELRPQSASYDHFTIDQIETELDNQNPVMFWNVPDSYKNERTTYQTPSGKTIDFFRDHVAVITGYDIVNGLAVFSINDPMFGKYTLTKDTLTRRMAKKDGRVVVIR